MANAAVISAAGVTLHGAPAGCTTAQADEPTKVVPAMQLEMTQDILDELLLSIRNGKPPQLLFGRNPVLKYGETKHVLETRTERFRTELYTSDSQSDMQFAGLMEDRLAVQRAKDVTAKADAALEALKSNMASIRKEKESHKMNIDDDAELLTNTKRQIPKKVGKGRSVFGGKVGSSYPSSPAPGSTAASPLPGTAPTSAPTSHLPAIQQALRIPLVHLLAIRPAKTQDLVQKTRASKDHLVSVLQKIAQEVEPNKWTLTNKAFKELDPWKFRYPSQEDRQAAIDNAVKAFDRQRLGSEEKQWQLLLPEEERGKGKTLSKLSLASAVQKTTPTIKPKLLKKGAIKKVEPKKTKKSEKVEDEKESKGVSAKRVAKAADEKPIAKAAVPLLEKQEKARPVEKETKPAVKKVPQTNGANPLPKKPVKARTNQPKITERPFTSTKRVQDTKPKNPSPLSASPPVNASDFEDNHPVHKALSASSSQAGKSTPGNSDRTLKRKANDLDLDIHKHDVSIKQRKTSGTPISSAGTKPSGTPGSDKPLKRKAPDHDADALRPAAKKPSTIPSKAPKPTTQTTTPQYSTASSTGSFASSRSSQASGGVRVPSQHHQQQHHHRTPPSPADSASPEPPLSMRQTLELSQKFKRYYDRYYQLHVKLSGLTEITQEQRDEFMRMHNKLQEMKAEIKKGARGK